MTLADSAGGRDRFFVFLAGILLLLVLLGFSRSFYLRASFLADQPALPVHLVVHGAILTLWFAVAFIQPLLVAMGNVSMHRLVGLAGGGIALSVVAATMHVLFLAASRPPTEGLPMEARPVVIIGNAVSLLIFSVLVATAIGLRRDGSSHKRLMLLASIALITQAIARLPGIPPLSPMIAVGQLALVAAMFVHDRIAIRRIHRATLFGTLFVVVASIAGGAIGASPAGKALIGALN